MKSRFRRRFSKKDIHLGFQIAPMIDVVFVILLYFMVASGTAKQERGHTTQLPGGYVPIALPDEITVAIEADGQIFLNDDPLDSIDSEALPELAGNLIQLKGASDGAGATLIVTIQADPDAKYQRVVDVLGALTRAKISNVTFQAEAE